MDFVLFIVATGVLFLRPLDFVPDLATLPLYLACLLAAAGSAAAPIVRQLSPTALAARPVTVCVLGVLGAILISHLLQGALWEARTAGSEFAKVVLYYLLLLAVVRSPDRLRQFLAWLAVFFGVVALLALLQYHGIIAVQHFEVLQQRQLDQDTGDVTILPRLVGFGMFNDPNDLCLILLAGMGIAAYFLLENVGLARLAWAVALAGFGYALALTQSRGGFIALMVGMLVLFQSRYGLLKAAALGGLTLPVLFLAFAGRQTSFTADGEAGSDRLELWREGLELLKEAPLFGVGHGAFADRVGLVAHNSYVHSFAELGYFGGTLFLGAVVTALWGVFRLGWQDAAIADPRLKRLRPYVLAIVTAYATGILSLSRCYIVPTYLMLGLAVAFVVLTGGSRLPVLPRFGGGYLGRLAIVSAGFLIALHLFLKFSALRG